MEEDDFKAELSAILNKYSKEQASGTPDFVLAQFMCASLAAYEAACDSKRIYDYIPDSLVAEAEAEEPSQRPCTNPLHKDCQSAFGSSDVVTSNG